MIQRLGSSTSHHIGKIEKACTHAYEELINMDTNQSVKTMHANFDGKFVLVDSPNPNLRLPRMLQKVRRRTDITSDALNNKLLGLND